MKIVLVSLLLVIVFALGVIAGATDGDGCPEGQHRQILPAGKTTIVRCVPDGQ